MDISRILAQPEGKTLEFKQDLSSPDRLLRTVVAFANTSGGILIIGVQDRTGRVLGIADPLAEEERLANLLSDGVAPTLVPDVEVVPWRKAHVLALQIHPSPLRPHYVRRLGPDSGVFVRVGSTNRRADEALIEELRRYVRNEAFDERAMPELSPEAIDFRAASESFAELRRLRRKDLLTLRMTTEHQGKLVPTIGGVLLFGKDRERYFPDAWIQAGRFEGLDRRRILDTAEIRGHLQEAVEEAIRFVRRNTAREAVIEGARHADRWTFPLTAVREAVVNAVVHADYSQSGAPIRVSIFADRMEVENPGLLPFGLTVDDIRGGISKLRNRVLGRVFHELGLIEQWGSGIQRMTAACLDAGLPAPEFEEIGTHFRVKMLATRGGAPTLDELEQKIVAALRAAGMALSTKQIAKAIERSDRTARTRLARLAERGVVAQVGTGPFDPKRVYFLTEWWERQ